MTVCFHGHTTCEFCWAGGRPSAMPRRRHRCPACGRTVGKVVSLNGTCNRCHRRGFHPLRLFNLRRKKTAA